MATKLPAQPTPDRLSSFFDGSQSSPEGVDNVELLEPPTSPFKYTVISAVYNVEKYLEDFFTSLRRQSLSFSDHIKVVMVDDGSTDRSPDIIKRWQARHRANIHYVRQKNRGQAAARNIGLMHAHSTWVTFIDPDDFVDRHYFREVDAILTAQHAKNISMLSANVLYYDEESGQTRDNHPLRFRFAQGTVVVPALNPGKFMQLSAATAFFRKDLLFRHCLDFDSRIRPAFEDAHFVGQYILHAQGTSLCFARGPRYYYRKRSDKSSTLDTGWENPARFREQLVLGTLGLIKAAKAKHLVVPPWLQRTVLYDQASQLRRIIDKSDAVSFLTPEQIDTYRKLLHEVFSHIDVQTIVNFELAKIGWFEKVGILGLFKNADMPAKIIYVDQPREQRGYLKLRHHSRHEDFQLCLQIDKKRVNPKYSKRRLHTFLSETWSHEHIYWIQVPKNGKLTGFINGEEVMFVVKGKRHASGVDLTECQAKQSPPEGAPLHARLLKWQAQTKHVRQKYGDAWLLMDRENSADDNAEHFYRYLQRERPSVNSFYILERNSVDWDRLERDGFRLIPYGSRQHRLALLHAAHLISSHTGRHIVSPMPSKWYGDMLHYRFTFLQHGIILHEVSRALNTVTIDLMVTSTQPEYESIVADGTAYQLSRKEVALTGLARHDALQRSVDPDPRRIVVMPTWRRSLVGPPIKNSSKRLPNQLFYESDFATRWRAFLMSERLQNLAAQQNCEVVFVLHFMFDAYTEWFRSMLPGVTVKSQSEGVNFQQLFQNARVLITDYSSVAFECAYIDRSVIYYQFDRDSFFGGGHGYKAGYFDYETDGFGPVVTQHDELLDAVAQALTITSPVYAARRAVTFAQRDGNNCRRIYEAILSLDSERAQDAATFAPSEKVG